MNEVGSLFDARSPLGRRGFLSAGATLAGLVLLSGCTTTAGTSGMARSAGGSAPSADVVRRLLELSTRNAFARLSAPDGFWNSPVARINMPVLFGRSAKGMPGVLRQPKFREQLLHRLNVIAEDGARAAAPQVEEAIRTLTFDNPDALVAGPATGATSYLRAKVGPTLVNAMIPAMDRLLRMADDPIISQAVAALKDVDMADAAHALALGADNAIWFEIGGEESAIRRDPNKGGDPLLMRALAR
ncbi:DUF4197 domain-containing protein [Novosphingobium sp. 9U]|uniref:DUF4197 domain-containing protein n=1 Tax=Novosphingobium sp. 9U TaxID=2653158 RepID=UPI0012F0C444|nr:DUF4197 domain-containing protein [Novosphingobium sp. 9U]VWX52371.1 conserved hypothetical protein [Novosphingobium sp. 9U]